MEKDRNDSRGGEKSGGPIGRSRASRAVFATTVVVALLCASIILMRSAETEETEPVIAASSRTRQPPAKRIPGFVPRRRGSAESNAGRRIDARIPSPRDSEDEATPSHTVAEETAALEEEVDEVIDNEPGREFPRGIDAADYIQKLRDMGETEGIAAFPPPGTNPAKAGVVVPEDYELPEGYERYYQYSDEGKPLEPILLFSPEYDFFDEEGNPVAISEDRVVPGDHAPEDLPVEILDPESPRETGGLIGQDQ